MTRFQFQSRKYMKRSFYELTRLEPQPLDEAPRPAMSALGQESSVDYTLNTVIGLISSAFEIKITD